MEAIRARHSVRQYQNKPLEPETIAALEQEIDACNGESGLHIQLITKEPKAFGGFMARYGSFSGVENYLALVGKKGAELEEKCGYYGESLVLKAQQLGLNTCWVALTYSKGKTSFAVAPGETLCIVISLGYGKNQGVPHRSKTADEVTGAEGPFPEWFQRGIESALLAPTAVNQQKFWFSLAGDCVTAKAGIGFYTKIDLGIAKYHFEIGAGKETFRWA